MLSLSLNGAQGTLKGQQQPGGGSASTEEMVLRQRFKGQAEGAP